MMRGITPPTLLGIPRVPPTLRDLSLRSTPELPKRSFPRGALPHMARVSLILPVPPSSGISVERMEELRGHLEASGHSVDLVAVADPRSPVLPSPADSWWQCLVAEQSGISAAAVAGLTQARGELLVFLDVQQDYAADDVSRVIEPLIRQDADLVVAARRLPAWPGGPPVPFARWAGALVRRIVGSADPFSGLIAFPASLTRDARLAPVGSFFTLEVLARTEGRRLDVPVSNGPGAVPRRWTLDDLRFLKRLADERYGNFSRLIQFCVVGASGTVVDLSFYALFQWLLARTWLAGATMPVIGGSLALAVAGALAIGLALTWNFSLNRRLTFSYARRGSLLRQFAAYTLSNALGIGLSFSLRLVLPRQFAFFQQHRLAAALVGIVAATGVSFSMARWFVFSRRSIPPDDLTDGASAERELAACP